MTSGNVDAVAGVLEGIGLLLDSHFTHESEASTKLLRRLDADEQQLLKTHLVAFDAPITTTSPAWWLPELLEREHELGTADVLSPEAMVGASCDPGALLLVRSAIAASGDGISADQWRATLREHSRHRLYIEAAETCMVSSGLWPWTTERAFR